MEFPIPEQREQRSIIILSLLSYLLLSFLDDIFVIKGFLFTPSAGIAAPLGILFGIPAVIGITVGALLSDILSLHISLNTLLHSFSIFLLSYIPYVSYQYGIGLITESNQTSVKSVARFVFVVIIACAGSAAFLAFGYELTGTAPFYISATYGFIESLLATVVMVLLIGPPIVYSQRVSTYTLPRTEDVHPPRIFRWSFVLVPPVWVLFGVIGSVGFRFRERVALFRFQERDLEFFYHIFHPDFFGQGARRVQLVLGTLMLLVLYISVRQFQNHTGGTD